MIPTFFQQLRISFYDWLAIPLVWRKDSLLPPTLHRARALDGIVYARTLLGWERNGGMIYKLSPANELAKRMFKGLI